MDSLTRELQRACRGKGLEDLLELYNLAIKGGAKSKTPYAYLFANTKDNEQSIFLAAGQLLERDLTETFLIVDGVEANGFPDYDKWNAGLAALIGEDRVSPIPIENKYGVNTLSESVALMRYIGEHEIGSICIVAAPFHILRAYMTVVSEAVRHDVNIRFQAQTGTELDWDQRVSHSQGIDVHSRREWLSIELDKIIQYGNILPAKVIIHYVTINA